jgi:hypothetical protein
MAGYTRDFLIDVAVHRFFILGPEEQAKDRILCEKAYDLYGKDKFRALTSVTAETIREYKAYQKNV